MKRRILLLLTTLAALLGAFYVYCMVAGMESRDVRPVVLPSTPRRPGGPVALQGAGIDNANELCIVARDAGGRLETVYLARKLNRRPDGSYHLVEPRVEIYHRGGQQTILKAREAQVYGEQLDRGANIRRAELHGNVEVLFDPNTSADRTPVEQRLDEAVRIYVDDVELDREHLTIRADGPVTVLSPQADVYGRGLVMSWNESPRELRLLRVERGEYMAVYDVPEELQVISVPGGADPAGAVASQPAKPRPRPAPTMGAKPDRRRRTTPGSGPATANATQPEEPAQNQYLAEFQDNVKVVHRSRSLSGADKLTLKFDWDPSWRSSREYLGAPRRPRTGGSASQPGSRPASRPATPEPMEVFWTGPLVLRPVGHTPAPSRQRYEVTATGPRVILTDPRATAACEEFTFRYPEQSGHLRSPVSQRVRLLLAEGADVGCQRIRFEPAAGKAWLDGAGYMARRFAEGLAQEAALELIETERQVSAPETQRITWAGDVDVAFTSERVRRPDGRTETRQFLDRADFHKAVELQQSGDPNGDRVRCDDLAMHMARGKRVTAYPREAVATGHVAARQEGSDIQAERITVRFREGSGDPATRPAPALGEFGRSVEPAFVLAEGAVKLEDRRDPNDDPLQAEADRVESDLIARTAVLGGQPARIQRGPNRLTGKVIKLNQAEGSAEVDGRGRLDFLSAKDINGNRLSQPRPVEVAWAEGMTFRGEKRTAAFSGDVTLDSGMDFVGCQNMQLIFGDPPAETQPATAPAGATKAARKERPDRFRSVGVGVERYSKRRISMILADKGVTLRSRRENDANQLIRRVQMTADKLIYDAEAARITSLGRGTFVAEDYLPPKKRTEPAAEGITPAVDRPSQSAFEWLRSMQFSQEQRLVVLDGQVKMVHRSGDQVVLTEKLAVPRDQWGTLPQGRKTVLVCDNMMAKFSQPEEPAQTRPATGPAQTRPARDPLDKGPDIGPLELFRASKDVNLKDGPRQVLAQRLIYNRLNDVAVIWGFADGAEPAIATVLYEDPKTGRSQSWSSPKITWYRDRNRIVTEEVTGAGGR